MTVNIGVTDEPFTPSWLTCKHRVEETGSACIGRQVDGYDHCLAHLGAAQLEHALERLGPSADLEAPGTDISPKLLQQILNAVEDENGVPALGSVFLAQARFTGSANFALVQFSGNANFTGARFTEGAVFDGAEFVDNALFIRVQVHGGSAS